MHIVGIINIRGYSKEHIQTVLQGASSQHESLTIESIRPTEGAVSVHVRQKFGIKLDDEGFAKAKERLIQAFYKEFGQNNVAYDLGYPAS